jgi:two-component system sensor histidine kinase HydH
MAAEGAKEDDGERERLAGRLAWITGLRLGFLSLLLAATAFFYLRGSLGEHPQSEVFVFVSIGGGFALAAVYASVLRGGRNLVRLAEAQIVLDQITWTSIVYVSGGATSGATSFYGLTCLVGAILIGLRGAAISAISGIALFTAMCAAFSLGWLRPPPDQGAANYAVTWDGMIYPLLVNALGIVVVALLAGYLAERLRTTGGALVRANERAMAAERLAMLGRIAAGLAHEIRNPLGSISGSVEMLREAPGLTDEDRRLCDIIRSESARLNNLVSDMMNLARPQQPEPRAVDVAKLAREVVELASRSDRGGSGDVEVRYVGPDAAVWATCDPAQMRQVLWNLVRNGVQASPAGSAVTVEVKRTRKRARLTVRDEGPGIDADSAAKIFDAFYTTRSHGTGMGLAVVRRILDDHAGVGAELRLLESDENAGRGATFEIGLVRCPAPGAEEGDELSDPGVTAPENDGSHQAES